LISHEARDFSLIPSTQSDNETEPASNSMGKGGFFLKAGSDWRVKANTHLCLVTNMQQTIMLSTMVSIHIDN